MWNVTLAFTPGAVPYHWKLVFRHDPTNYDESMEFEDLESASRMAVMEDLSDQRILDGNDTETLTETEVEEGEQREESEFGFVIVGQEAVEEDCLIIEDMDDGEEVAAEEVDEEEEEDPFDYDNFYLDKYDDIQPYHPIHIVHVIKNNSDKFEYEHTHPFPLEIAFKESQVLARFSDKNLSVILEISRKIKIPRDGDGHNCQDWIRWMLMEMSHQGRQTKAADSREGYPHAVHQTAVEMAEDWEDEVEAIKGYEGEFRVKETEELRFKASVLIHEIRTPHLFQG